MAEERQRRAKKPKRSPIAIRDSKHAAEVVREYRLLKQSIAVTEEIVESLRDGLDAWMREHGLDAIEQEGFETLRRIDKIRSYEWDIPRMQRETPEMFARVMELGLLTIKKGEYDKAVLEHGPIGALSKYARGTGGSELRFEKPLPKAPRSE